MVLFDLPVQGALPFDPSNAARVVLLAPAQPGVYFICHKDAGPDDRCVVYIGSASSAGGLRQRLAHYFSPGPTQRTNQRILKEITASRGHDLFYLETLTGGEAKDLEARLLEAFKNRFGRLPTYNLKMPSPGPSRASALRLPRTTKTLTIATVGTRTRTVGGNQKIRAMAEDGTPVVFWGGDADVWNLDRVTNLSLPATIRCVCVLPPGARNIIWVPQDSPVELVSISRWPGEAGPPTEWAGADILSTRDDDSSDFVEEDLAGDGEEVEDWNEDDEDGERPDEDTSEMDDYDEDGDEVDPERGNDPSDD